MSRGIGSKRRLVVLAGLVLAGCGRFGTTRDPAAADQARALLGEALAAWRGDRVAALSSRTPPIRLVDDDQVAGLKLVGYDIKPPPPGLDPPGIAATLTLRDTKGHAIVRHASYRVRSDAPIVVQREDF